MAKRPKSYRRAIVKHESAKQARTNSLKFNKASKHKQAVLQESLDTMDHRHPIYLISETRKPSASICVKKGNASELEDALQRL